MHAATFEYRRPGSIEEALQHLGEDGARPLAGGHSLLPVMKQRLAAPAILVDIGRIDELSRISSSNGTVEIGATTTHAAVAGSDVVTSKAPLLAQTARLIGDMQVRNRGTIGGSLAHADPAADLPPTLIALGATINVRGVGGERSIPAAEFFTDLFTTALDEGELVTSVTIPTQDGKGGAYLKHRHPASSYAVVGVAALAGQKGDVVGDLRVVVGGASGTAIDVTEAVASLAGTPADDNAIANATAGIADLITNPMGDVYASGEYRRHLATVLAKRAIGAALGRN